MGDFNAKIGSTNNIMEHTIAELNWVFFFNGKNQIVYMCKQKMEISNSPT